MPPLRARVPPWLRLRVGSREQRGFRCFRCFCCFRCLCALIVAVDPGFAVDVTASQNSHPQPGKQPRPRGRRGDGPAVARICVEVPGFVEDPGGYDPPKLPWNPDLPRSFGTRGAAEAAGTWRDVSVRLRAGFRAVRPTSWTRRRRAATVSAVDPGFAADWMRSRTPGTTSGPGSTTISGGPLRPGVALAMFRDECDV